MTLKEQLEILRGEPIREKAPIEQIPCIETSDPEKLCKHPVVSVNMITYNHEPYIRQAIEGVLMQQTDFEFELIIGEDASQDKTREICFEYQQKYPDKIRVLWSEENVNHLGGNSRRVRARSRGEFIALCEGDDYWTDPLKLQKQVDVMRQHPDVGLCFCGAEIYNEKINKTRKWDSGSFPPGKMSGETFLGLHFFGSKKNTGSETFIMTATTLFRKSIYDCAIAKYEIFNWRLLLGDTTLWTGLSLLSNVYFLKDETALYRVGGNGITNTLGPKVSRDAVLVRLFFLTIENLLKKQEQKNLTNFESLVLTHLILSQAHVKKSTQISNYLKLIENESIRTILFKKHNFLIRFFLRHGWIRTGGFFIRYIHYRNDFFQKVKKRFGRV